MLQINNLQTGYGKKQVLYGLSLEVRAGEIVGIIGPNGSGKSTTLKAVCGLVQPWKGLVRFEGTPDSLKDDQTKLKNLFL